MQWFNALTIKGKLAAAGAVLALGIIIWLAVHYSARSCKGREISPVSSSRAPGSAAPRRFKGLADWSEFEAELTPPVWSGLMDVLIERCRASARGKCPGDDVKCEIAAASRDESCLKGLRALDEFLARHGAELREVVR